MARVIAIANEKGGVAKTTTAISVGGVLAEMGRNVLLIDMDPQASLTVYLGFAPHGTNTSIADVLLNAANPIPLHTTIPNIALLPSHPDLAFAERSLTVREHYKQTLRHSIEGLDNYDEIIIDCPPSLGVLTQNALVAAELLIMPVVPEYLAVYALRDTTQLIRSIRETDNPQLSYRILFTIVDQRIKSHNTICSRFREKFGEAIYQTVIQIDTRLRDASIAGLPITHYIPGTRSSTQYRALVHEALNNDGHK
jgi:chromosome partitioning protein